MKDPLVYQTQQLLKFNKISFDKEELAFQIKSHPSYPSLHAITGVLDHFNIENLALDIPVNEETLRQLPLVFLAQIHTDRGKEFAVIKNEGLEYEIISNVTEKVILSLREFLKIFTGIIVAVEKDLEQKENQTSVNQLLKNTVVGSAVTLFLVLFLMAKPSISDALFFIFSILGLFISASIYSQELGEESILGNAFCSGETASKSCDDVLSSKGAKIVKGFKISDLSIVYFIGSTLAIYFLTLLGIGLTTPIILSFLAIPMTIYSIYYQYAVVKKWCLLCISIVGILWVQAIIGGTNMQAIENTSIQDIVITALFFSVALIGWNFISSLLNSKKDFKKNKINFFKFKKNFNLFNALLEKSKTIPTDLSDTSEIVFGTVDSPLHITIITNPFCGHCRAVHTLIEDILKKHSDSLKISVRFNINPENVDSDSVRVTSRLLELYHTQGEDSCMDAMHDIYEGQALEMWIQKWGECKDISTYIETLKAQSTWCIDNAINFTPEILINGKSFPKEYDRSDLIFFIEELEENCCQELVPDTSYQ